MEIKDKLSRRNFIKFSGMTGAALTLGMYASAKGLNQEVVNLSGAKDSGVELNAWISIDVNGKVTIMNHR